MQDQLVGGLGVVLLATLLAGVVGPVDARVYLTQQEAIEKAFPETVTVERVTVFLTESETAWIDSVAGTSLASKIAICYAGWDADTLVGVAYFDVHIVRTLSEAIMILVRPGGKVERVDILSFDEPEDYLPSAQWLRQFEGHPLEHDLALKRGIRAITGATLSARAVTDAVRRTLALHQLLREKGRFDSAPEGDSGSGPPRGGGGFRSSRGRDDSWRGHSVIRENGDSLFTLTRTVPAICGEGAP